MLCLKSKVGQKVIINGGQIVVTVIEIGRGVVRLGFTAPPEIVIHREEIQKRIDAGQSRPTQPDSPTITATNWFNPTPPPQKRKST